MDDLISWTNAVIAASSLLSLIVSVIALIKSNRAQLRIIAIEEQREEERRMESLQAKIQPKLVKTLSNSYRLYLINHGKAAARNIRVKLDEVPLAEHRATVRGDSMPSDVGPGGQISCLLALSVDCMPPFKIQILWDDDSGTDRSYVTTLTL